ncbi:MAG: CHRD domain-containing protein [Phycisphaerae bacterium]|nr:CHRD domain-containing protein [Phycisphaerae bacterium]
MPFKKERQVMRGIFNRLLSGMAGAAVVLLGAASADAAICTRSCVLMGAQEVPANASAAVGAGQFVIDTTNNTVSFRIVVAGLGTAETAAHIHGIAGPGANAGVIFALPLGPVKTGVWNYPPAFEDALLNGRLYVNVHTVGFPGGEVRGQITTHTAVLDGIQETPSVATAANGFGVYNLNAFTGQLEYYIAYAGLGSPETAAHFHGRAIHGVAAGVVFALPAGSPKSGVWPYTGAVSTQDLIDGLVYTNIHTVGFPGGEIRGQMCAAIEPADGMQEVPVTPSASAGRVLVAINRATDQLTVDVARSGFGTGETAAHIHAFAPPGANAGVALGLAVGARKFGTWAYGAANEPAVLMGNSYVNMHTTAFPGGEIRGQLFMPSLICCPGDYNNDGSVDDFDFFDFLNDFNTSNPRADFNNDGSVDDFDFFDFLNAFTVRC